jgi:hypothetical protein
MNGCFRLEVVGAPPIEYDCRPFPTDLWGPELPSKILPLAGPVTVRATGRPEAPVAIAWRASGGPTDLLFRVERIDGSSSRELASVSYAGSEFQAYPVAAKVFLDPAAISGVPCYRVTAVSSAGESVIGQACLGDAAPGPPDAGSGLPKTDRNPWFGVGLGLVLCSAVAWALGHRRAPLRSRC